MNDLLFEPGTKTQLETFLARPTHALLLVAPEGAGKATLARHIAAQLLGVADDKLSDHPYVTFVKPIKHSISIDEVRELQRAVQLKTLGEGKSIRRVLLIEGAEAMTREAQNALLKLLEEPPSDTLLILTTTNLRELLPTIVSRAQRLAVKAPTEQAVESFFAAAGFETAAIEQAYRLSNGLPGLMSSLLRKSDDHPLLQALETAKRLVGSSTFSRLVVVDELTKQKTDLRPLLLALKRLAHVGLEQAATKGDTNLLKRWTNTLRAASDAQTALDRNAQTKLLLTNLMLEL